MDFAEHVRTHYRITDRMPDWPEAFDEPQPASRFPVRALTFPTAEAPRLDEPSLVELGGGTLLFAYANHTGRGDNDGSDIVAVELSRDGKVLSDERLLVRRPEGGLNAMSPALRRLPDGRIGMVYSHRESVRAASRRFTASSDQGRTWSEPVVAAGGAYKTGCHDRFLVHSSGRLIAPCHCTEDWDSHYLHVRVARSDDGGRGWTLGDSIELPRQSWPDERRRIESGCVEPCAVERADGSLLMTMRTAMGTQFKSESRDRGETWSAPVSMEVSSPTAPCHLSRVPGTDILVIVWNPHYNALEPNLGLRRTVMVATSVDGGRTWPYERRRVLIHDPVGSVSYPTVTYVGAEAWITLRISTVAVFVQGGLTGTGLLRVPIEWLLAS